MTPTFFAVWIVLMLGGGALIAWLTWAVESERFSPYRIRTPKQYRLPPVRKFINVNLNLILSLGIFCAFLSWFGHALLRPEWPGFVLLLGESLGVLLLYDFMYYFFHRGMHHRRLMSMVHYVHHYVRYPTAQESTYLHPLENIIGLCLLWLAIWAVGPISGASFLVVFAVHMIANILVHSNLVFPHPAFRLFNFWAEKHDIHHSKLNYNYASIFPFWDQAFGTYK